MKRLFIFVMMLGLAVSGQSQSTVTVEAGKSYTIALANNAKKSLFVRNSANADGAPVVLWTETNVPAQQWTVEVNDEGQFAFKNAYTDKYLNYANNLLSLHKDKSWWTLEPAGQDGKVCYLMKTNKYLHVDGTADDSAPTLGNAQAWQFIEVDTHTELDDYVRQYMANGYLQQYMQDKGTGYRTFNNGGWGESETLETLLDMYENSGDRRYLTIYEACYNNFKYHVGDTWTGGTKVGDYNWFGYSFNDDVMWQIIGAARAYLLTGKSVYLTDAKRNFDLIWNRAYLGYVGLLRWAENDGDRNGANSCINGPAEVAACYIALGTGDETYFEKAKELYWNQREYLANMTTGDVYDAVVFDPVTVEVKSRNTWVSTYNQGTMLGAAIMLYQHYGDQQYKKDADKIIARSRSSLCDSQGIIHVCQDAGKDYQGFKGILMRYAGMYVRQFPSSTITNRFGNWIKSNAMRAYCNLNSKGFGHSAWLTKAAENMKFGDTDYSDKAFGGSTSLAAAFALPLTPSDVEEVTPERTVDTENTVQFTVPAVQTPGHYRLNVYYKTSTRQTVYLTVNDATAMGKAFTVTGDYTGVRPYFITLRRGDNTLSFTSSATLPTIEKVEVIYLSPVENSLEAEHATSFGKAVIVKDANASGGQYMGNIGGGSNNYITFYYDAEETGDYELDITYFTGEDRQMYINLNGSKEIQTFEKTGSYYANSARTKTFTVKLNTGTNTIALGNNSGSAPNVDKIELRRVQSSEGIGDTMADQQQVPKNPGVFNLRGQRVVTPGKGLYIMNGKKLFTGAVGATGR